MSELLLKRHRVLWEKKPVLRAIYAAWYKEIIGALKPGKTLELGGGSGNFKAHFPEAVTSDLIPLPWLDLVLDAHDLPLRDSSIFNAVLFDVLHHLENPRFFFDEVVRVLRPEDVSFCWSPMSPWHHILSIAFSTKNLWICPRIPSDSGILPHIVLPLTPT